MDKKNRIISIAIALFNKQGSSSFSMRGIAKGCAMSLSNLQHHFSTKDKLLEAIFQEMCLVFEGAADFTNAGISLKLLIDMNATWHQFQKKYKFFFIEIAFILQHYPTLRKQYGVIKSRRVDEYTKLFHAYADAGLFHKEPFYGFFYTQAELLWFTANYLLCAKIAEGDKYSSIKEETDRLITIPIYTLLTPKGLAELANLNYKQYD